MKRILSCLLVFSLLLTPICGNVFAATEDEEDEDRKTLVVDYEDIESLVSENDSLDTSSLQAAVTSYQNRIADLTNVMNNLSSQPDLQKVVSEQINQLNSDLAQMKASIASINSSQETLVMTAQQMFVSYNSLVAQRNELNRSKTVLNANIRAAEKQYELGMITELSLENIKKEHETLNNSIAAMDDQLKLLAKSFNLLIGRDYDDTIRFKSTPQPDYSYKNDIRHNSDLEDALSANITSLSDEQFKSSFESLYKAVQEKDRALQMQQNFYALEQKNYAASQKQYELGLISELDMISAQNSLDTQIAKVRSAQDDLFLAIEQYRWAVERGVVSQS